MKNLCIVFAIALCATAAAAARLPPGTYVQHGDGGEHAAASLLGGYVVVFDGQLFVWNGSVYKSGPCTLEFIDGLDGDYGWILVCPHHIDTGIVTSTR